MLHRWALFLPTRILTPLFCVAAPFEKVSDLRDMCSQGSPLKPVHSWKKTLLLQHRIWKFVVEDAHVPHRLKPCKAPTKINQLQPRNCKVPWHSQRWNPVRCTGSSNFKQHGFGSIWGIVFFPCIFAWAKLWFVKASVKHLLYAPCGHFDAHLLNLRCSQTHHPQLLQTKIPQIFTGLFNQQFRLFVVDAIIRILQQFPQSTRWARVHLAGHELPQAAWQWNPNLTILFCSSAQLPKHQQHTKKRLQQPLHILQQQKIIIIYV